MGTASLNGNGGFHVKEKYLIFFKLIPNFRFYMFLKYK